MWWSGILNGNNNPLPVFHVASSGCCWEALCVYVWAVSSLHSSGRGPKIEHDQNSQLRVKCPERGWGGRIAQQDHLFLSAESRGGRRNRQWWAWLLSKVALPVFQTPALVECPQAAALCPSSLMARTRPSSKSNKLHLSFTLYSLCKGIGLIFVSCLNWGRSVKHVHDLQLIGIHLFIFLPKIVIRGVFWAVLMHQIPQIHWILFNISLSSNLLVWKQEVPNFLPTFNQANQLSLWAVQSDDT